MAFTLLFEGTIPKYLESPDDNEDSYQVAIDDGRVVISDGASESFDARNWSRLLVGLMINEELSLDGMAGCAEEYEVLHDANSLSWSKAAAYERGSFATLLLAQDWPDSNVVKIRAVGDSLAVWVANEELVASAPYTNSLQFQDKPTLLSTRLALNEKEDSWGAEEWSYQDEKSYALLCMTDALGAWLLSHHELGDSSALKTLCEIRDMHEFLELVKVERAAGRLRLDDTTLIVLSVTNLNGD